MSLRQCVVLEVRAEDASGFPPLKGGGPLSKTIVPYKVCTEASLQTVFLVLNEISRMGESERSENFVAVGITRKFKCMTMYFTKVSV